jgi:cyclohexanone monooxygenase
MRTARNSQFWRGPMVFIRMLDEWRKDGTLPGLELTTMPDQGRAA